MSTALIRQLPSGRWQVYCRGCNACEVTPFKEVALKDAQGHECPGKGAA